MFFAVTNVEALDNYLLQLQFKDGQWKMFDMKPCLEIGVFRALKDEKLFKTARVSFDTVEWPNEIDIDPETLYHESILITR